ncbi:Ldh family oxidoreductase [Salicibibacter cibarius]|uniref:Ldh family oxidoreductase n=1 Tax=Salicibibacter cibarius TaxID=2743000 RepID=A0A7T7CAX7_9BACI|nr:Ldh family oxidoreductase [Salicibibacter cibarius]QQK75362.1 Ldh family oxidoreductase [Salicibibacter cibarius]
MSDSYTYIEASHLTEVSTLLFESEGMKKEDANTIAKDLVAANLRGLDSHGVSRIPMYLKRIRKGVVNPNPDIKVENITSAVSKINGDAGMGFLAGHRAMTEAMDLARESGIGLVGIYNSTHYGMAALYVMEAMKEGFISMAYTNSSPAIPPWGGRTAYLGANPFAAAVPSGNESSYVLDMAMTVIARGKIRLAATNDEPIAEGLALNKDGAPTTDANEAFEGVCLPFGEAKGSALAMLVELLSGVLTGANYGGDVKSLYFDHSEPQNAGHLFIAIRPDLFMAKTEFDNRMDEFVKRTKSLPRAEGFDEILIPGEPEERKAQERLRTGIPISENVVADLRREIKTSGINASI